MHSKKLALLAAKACQDTKAVDPVILNLTGLTHFTDYFIICSGRSDKHVQAISDHVVEKTGSLKRKPIGMEGYRLGHWILLDYGDVVVHIFYHETRDYYGLEKIWSDARGVPLQ